MGYSVLCGGLLFIVWRDFKALHIAKRGGVIERWQGIFLKKQDFFE
jgi:hypothetical protein